MKEEYDFSNAEQGNRTPLMIYTYPFIWTRTLFNTLMKNA